MASRTASLHRRRSSKAGRPVDTVISTAQKTRRRKTASAALKKAATLLQTGERSRETWRASRPKGKKR